MDALTATLMSIGTGTAAGLRPYLTVLLLAAAGLAIPDSATGVLHQVDSAVPTAIANPWVLGVCLVLALGDGGLDKIIGVNLPLEGLNQVLRPVFGALVGVGIGSQVDVGTAIVSGIIGGASALPVSLGKGGMTAGMTMTVPSPSLQVVRSVTEDITAVVTALAALLLPLLGAVLGILLIGTGVALVVVFRKARRRVTGWLGGGGSAEGAGAAGTGAVAGGAVAGGAPTQVLEVPQADERPESWR